MGQDRTAGLVEEIRAAVAAAGEPPELDEPDQLDDDRSVPIARVASAVLQQAAKERAAAILLEPDARRLRVRYRVDGMHHEKMFMPRFIVEPLTARCKMLAGLNPTVRHEPQQGAFRLTYGGAHYPILLETLPAPHGERILLRLYDRELTTGGLERLGMEQPQRDAIDPMLARRAGLIVVAGPADSGRTTTLYTVLRGLDREAVSVVTLDARPEYELDQATQLTWPADSAARARLMDAVWRQDADVIAFGDLLDAETASAAVDLAQERLVLATFRAADAADAIVRLLALDLPHAAFLECLLAVTGQRLARRVCPDCRQPTPAAASDLAAIGLPSGGRSGAFEAALGAGCSACRQTGYRGQIGCFEVLPALPDLLGPAAGGADAPTLRALLADAGVRSLWQDLAGKAVAGVTSLDEARRILRDERPTAPPRQAQQDS